MSYNKKMAYGIVVFVTVWAMAWTWGWYHSAGKTTLESLFPKSPVISEDAKDNEAYDLAALSVIKKRHPELELGYALTPDEIKSQRSMIAEEKKRAESLRDENWRRAFLGWIDFFSSRLDEREEDLQTQIEVDNLLSDHPVR